MISYQSVIYYYFVLTAVALFYFFTRKISKSQSIFVLNLLFHSLLFYFNKKQFIQFQLLVGINFLVIYLYQKEERSKIILPLSVLINILYFTVVKFSYWSLASHLGAVAFIGFSFFTFRLVSIYVDLKRKVIKQKIEFIDYFNYLTFFPVFLSGPLNRYNQFVEDLHSTVANPPLKQFDYTYRIIWGTFKKVVLADYLLNFSIDSIHISDLYHLPSYKILISLYVYSVVLYLDFSGYSDMAIGICGLFGITIPENFNKPFSSKNIQEFWNRWHISFMHWLRDYVYYPIQIVVLKSKIISSALIASILGYMITFLIAGLWHGNQVQYLYYGLYHGLAFSVYLAWKTFIQKKLSQEQKNFYYSSKIVTWASIFITYNYFVFGLLFFTGKYVFFFKTLKDL